MGAQFGAPSAQFGALQYGTTSSITLIKVYAASRSVGTAGDTLAANLLALLVSSRAAGASATATGTPLLSLLVGTRAAGASSDATAGAIGVASYSAGASNGLAALYVLTPGLLAAAQRATLRATTKVSDVLEVG